MMHSHCCQSSVFCKRRDDMHERPWKVITLRMFLHLKLKSKRLTRKKIIWNTFTHSHTTFFLSRSSSLSRSTLFFHFICVYVSFSCFVFFYFILLFFFFILMTPCNWIYLNAFQCHFSWNRSVGKCQWVAAKDRVRARANKKNWVQQYIHFHFILKLDEKRVRRFKVTLTLRWMKQEKKRENNEMWSIHHLVFHIECVRLSVENDVMCNPQYFLHFIYFFFLFYFWFNIIRNTRWEYIFSS